MLRILSTIALVFLCAMITHVSALAIPSDQRIISSTKASNAFIEQVDGRKNTSAKHSRPKASPDFAVGIELATSYATVSVAYKDGTIRDIAKIEARTEYKKMMKRLSLESSKHPRTPYVDMEDAVSDHQRQLDRLKRKNQGLPTSDDVYTYAELLQSAREEAELYLWQPIETVSISTPNLVAVYAEDISDASKFIGLNIAKKGVQPTTLLHSSSSSILNNGLGLCKNTTNLSACLKESSHLLERTALSIQYTRDALIISPVILKPSLYSWPSTISPPTVRFDLGHDALQNDPSGAFYWAKVSEALTKVFMERLVARNHPSQIFLSGERASDRTFRVVLEGVAKTLIGEVPEMRDEGGLYAASRGAAWLGLKRGVEGLVTRSRNGEEKAAMAQDMIP